MRMIPTTFSNPVPPALALRSSAVALSCLCWALACGGRSSLDELGGGPVTFDGSSGGLPGTSGGGSSIGGGATGGFADSGGTAGADTGGASVGGDGGGGGQGSGGDGSGGDGSGGDGSGGDGSGGDGSGGSAPLWRESYEPYCNTDAATQADAPQVWADSRGVFVAEGSSESLLMHNPGDGWVSYWGVAGSVGSVVLGGVDAGSLYFGGRSTCQIMEVFSPSQASCSGVPANLADLYMVSTNDGVAIGGDRVLVYDGADWAQLGQPLAADESVTGRAIWADDAMIVAATSQGGYWASRTDDEMTPIEFLEGKDLRSVWGYGNEIWMGADTGELYYFDGGDWASIETLSDGCPSIRGIWGTDTDLYLRTKYRVYSYSALAGAVEVFGGTCDGSESVSSIWGLSSDELFFTTVDYTRGDCERTGVYWFDGTDVTRF